MVGIGKTTLAKKVYGDPSVALHFNVRGWITIPQDYTKRQMLCDLLQFILPAELNVIKKGSTTDELEAEVLRVLAFDTSIFLQRVPLNLGNLVFLRYLSITKWFEDLDDVVSNNLNLQTLVVSSNGAPSVHLPSSIWKPPHLRHLELGNLYIVDPPSMVKENLQSLSCVVRPIHCRKEVYDKFPNIKKLKIFLKDDTEASATHGSCSNPIILDHLAYLEGLEKLSISISTGCIASFPEWAMYPSRLKKLKLSGTNISERDLTVIAMLRELRVLKLENAFHGTVWNSVVKGGFYSLNFLLLEAKKLKQWVASSDQFPVLKHLVLRSCYCLERIPERFARTSTPVSIELEGCHSSLVASAKRLQRKKSSKNLKDAWTYFDNQLHFSHAQNATEWFLMMYRQLQKDQAGLLLCHDLLESVACS
nr:putative late blight resistance protein homolog R1A-4 isoform X2 [Ipomoea trifida]